MPNFHEVPQSTTQMKLLPVLENGHPPYWNSISGFDFNLCIVIGIPFCICLPNLNKNVCILVASLGGWTAPGDTIQGVTLEIKKNRG